MDPDNIPMDFSRAQAAQSYSESSDEGHEARASGNSVGEGASNSVPANPASTSIVFCIGFIWRCITAAIGSVLAAGVSFCFIWFQFSAFGFLK
ncbi:hypothetical protein RHGRI_037756 [Rhododendron griersonianum]|uniref:Transmembrane protein n=1 Tax=Rhododendron griersonianum TaxID=479676 RepID=A0AAV6HTM3_9ERIC|nr:hypothetical protein RHGRI_037756 [Rhododendron griersonianum]